MSTEPNPLVATKIGEAAHIRAARRGEARFDDSMNDKERAHIDNGIWLCASCHTMIDKNGGGDFSVELIVGWKQQHEEVIRSLLLSHKSPLPHLRRFIEEGRVAQEVVDTLAAHGAFYQDFPYEVPGYVTESLARVRQQLLTLQQRIEYDNELREIIRCIAKECQTYMNKTSPFEDYRRRWNALQTARDNIGVYLKRLRDEYGCRISGDINRIIP